MLQYQHFIRDGIRPCFCAGLQLLTRNNEKLVQYGKAERSMADRRNVAAVVDGRNAASRYRRAPAI
jgi:hypothetical protein